MRVRGPVYAVLGLHHPWGVNAGFVATEEGVVVVDASRPVHAAKIILGYVRAEAPGRQ